MDWTGSVDLSNDLDEFKAISMETEVNVEGQNKQLSLGIHVDRSNCLDLYMYSPYWIVNKTGLPVQIRVCCLDFCIGRLFLFILFFHQGSRSEAVYMNDSCEDPLLFRFKKHRRKKVCLFSYH